mgnify:FL=1
MKNNWQNWKLRDDDLKIINSLRYDVRKYYNRKKHKNLIKRLLANLRDRHIIIIQTEALQGKRWPFKCTAGVTDLILESDGSLRICELTPKIGNMIKEPYEKLLKTEKAKNVFQGIENHRCDCTHICNLSSSMDRYFKDILFSRFIYDSIKKRKYFK